MSIKLTNTFLFVKNIEVSKKFYIEYLDIDIKQSLDGYIVFTNGLALWELPNDSIIAEKLENQLNRERNNRVELYFETDDVDSYFERIKKQQIKLLHEIHEEPWGQKDFRFFDPDDNLVEIGEAMDHVALRLYRSRMEIAEVVAKTGMNEERIKNIVDKAICK